MTTTTRTFGAAVTAYYLGRPRRMYEARYRNATLLPVTDPPATCTGYGLAIFDMFNHRVCDHALAAPWTPQADGIDAEAA